jgi:mevalonate kinase
LNHRAENENLTTEFIILFKLYMNRVISIRRSQVQKNFTKTSHAKCILVGEHAVMRGYSGIVFPVHHKTFTLNVTNDGQELTVHSDVTMKDLSAIFWQMIHFCCELLGKKISDVHGNFFLKNNIPIGYGLGFSSAMTVNLANWAKWLRWIEDKQLFSFAKRLEDSFHVRSSGIDIVGVMTNCVVVYNKLLPIRKLALGWKPCLFLSSSGVQSATKNCVEKVATIHKNNSILGKTVDKKMADSVALAEHALTRASATALPELAQAMMQAYACFEHWGLVNDVLRQHIDLLMTEGALAAKPTGSGDGGYVLSVWQTPPRKLLPFELLPIL